MAILLGSAHLGSAHLGWLPDHGMVTAIRWLTVASVGCFAVAFTLPRRARDEADETTAGG